MIIPYDQFTEHIWQLYDLSYDKILQSPGSCLTALMALQTNKLESLITNCSRNYVYTDVITRQSALVSKRKWLPAFGHRCIMQIRQLAVPAPRQRHIYGRIVEVLCAWSNGGTGVGRHRNERVKWVRVSVSFAQPQTNVVVTMATHHILRIFEIS